MLTTNLNGHKPEPECAAAVRAAATLCESLGHRIEPVDVPPGLEALTPAVIVIVCTSLATTLDTEVNRRGRAVSDDEIEEMTKLLYERGKAITSVEYVRALQTIHAIARSFAAWFAAYDMMLLPTLGQLPLPVGMLKDGIGDLESLVARFYNYGPNTQLFNATGHPAMSVPLHWTDDEIPVGVQFVGRATGEAMLFRLAGQMERARPWADRRPPEP
jgi:amidase